MFLLTGGLGYIGSHVAACFTEPLVLLDNLHNSNISVLASLRALAPSREIHFYEGDVRDRALLDRIFAAHPIHTVLHFAALKSVKDSFAQREEYEAVNVGGTRTLLDAMEAAGCQRLVFSSSATVYGAATPPLSEATEAGVGITNPYGQTKWDVEQLLRTRPAIRSVILRYFNPVGAHPSGTLGEAPNGTPANLFPVLLRCLRENKSLTIFGQTWPTRDGTCARDFINIMDLAEAHLCATYRHDTLTRSHHVFLANVGTGRATTVLEVLACFEQATGVRIPYIVGPPREGDLGEVYAAVDAAKLAALGWRPVRSLAESCWTAWQFQQMHS